MRGSGSFRRTARRPLFPNDLAQKAEEFFARRDWDLQSRARFLGWFAGTGEGLGLPFLGSHVDSILSLSLTAMPNACIFCGSTTSKITNEHVVSEWIGKLLPNDKGVATYAMLQPDGSVQSFQAPALQQTVRVPCKQCNSGWMRKIEDNVISKLGPMIQSARVTRLIPSTQKAIATWAVKTALILQYLHPRDKVIPDSEYQRFYAVKQPPSRYVVLLGRCNPHIDATRTMPMIANTYLLQRLNVIERQQVEQMTDYVVFLVLFAIGHAAFGVMGTDAPIELSTSGNLTLGLTDNAQRIWPIHQRVTWPPPRSAVDLSAFRNLFANRPPGQDPIA